MERKKVVWESDSREVLRTFPVAVRQDLGAALGVLQVGERPDDTKSMKAIGLGAWELRARDSSGQYRAIYVAIVKGEIHVLHCFQKKSQKTSRYDIEKAATRYRALISRLKG